MENELVTIVSESLNKRTLHLQSDISSLIRTYEKESNCKVNRVINIYTGNLYYMVESLEVEPVLEELPVIEDYSGISTEVIEELDT